MLHDNIQSILDTLKPMLATHGKDVSLVEADDQNIKLSLTGFCGDCGCSQDYVDGLKEMLGEQFPDKKIIFEIV